jgi:hypothetical protein
MNKAPRRTTPDYDTSVNATEPQRDGPGIWLRFGIARAVASDSAGHRPHEIVTRFFARKFERELVSERTKVGLAVALIGMWRYFSGTRGVGRAT